MTSAMCEPMCRFAMKAVEPAELTEVMRGQLVRGQETRLLESVGPLVLEHNVTLDLINVERIDAAGITALVALYQSARKAGRRFRLTNVSERVAQILATVGLDRILLSHIAAQSSQYGLRLVGPKV